MRTFRKGWNGSFVGILVLFVGMFLSLPAMASDAATKDCGEQSCEDVRASVRADEVLRVCQEGRREMKQDYKKLWQVFNAAQVSCRVEETNLINTVVDLETQLKKSQEDLMIANNNTDETQGVADRMKTGRDAANAKVALLEQQMEEQAAQAKKDVEALWSKFILATGKASTVQTCISMQRLIDARIDTSNVDMDKLKIDCIFRIFKEAESSSELSKVVDNLNVLWFRLAERTNDPAATKQCIENSDGTPRSSGGCILEYLPKQVAAVKSQQKLEQLAERDAKLRQALLRLSVLTIDPTAANDCIQTSEGNILSMVRCLDIFFQPVKESEISELQSALSRAHKIGLQNQDELAVTKFALALANFKASGMKDEGPYRKAQRECEQFLTAYKSRGVVKGRLPTDCGNGYPVQPITDISADPFAGNPNSTCTKEYKRLSNGIQFCNAIWKRSALYVETEYKKLMPETQIDFSFTEFSLGNKQSMCQAEVGRLKAAIKACNYYWHQRAKKVKALAEAEYPKVNLPFFPKEDSAP